MRLFISYGHDHNAPLVERIRADLEAAGYETWIDRERIKAGDDWRRAILDAVRASDMTLAFLSKYSTRNPGVCLDELAISLHWGGGNIATVLVESEDEVRPPVSVGHVQWLDMHDWRERQSADQMAFEAWYRDRLENLLTVLASPHTHHFAGEVEQLAHILRPVPQEADIAALTEGFTGRLWLFEALNAWRLREQESRLFWISGAPGTGKSAFAAWLAHFARANIVGAVFCRHDMIDRRDPARVVRTLAFQVATRLPDYRRLLLAGLRRDDPDGDKLDRREASSLFDGLLVQPLRLCIDGGRMADRVIALLDGLDETMRDGQSELAELLAEQTPKLPPWFGLVVTSRPEPAIQRQFEVLRPHHINAESWQNQVDLRLFVRSWLVEKEWARNDLHGTIERVIAEARGSFLYVRLLKEGINAGVFDLAELGRLPPGHAAIFERWFRRQFPQLESYRQVALPLLRLVRTCGIPLRMSWAEAALGLSPAEIYRTREALGALFPLERGAIRACHKSLFDWLCDPARSGPWFVPEADDRGCMNLLRAIVQDMAELSKLGRTEFWREPSILGECDRLARHLGYVPRGHASDIELPELEVLWRNYFASTFGHERQAATEFIRFALEVSGQFLAEKHSLTFAQMSARLVDLRSFDGAFDIAMRYACWALESLRVAGRERGPAVVMVRRAGARALEDRGGHEEQYNSWSAAADAAERDA